MSERMPVEFENDAIDMIGQAVRGVLDRNREAVFQQYAELVRDGNGLTLKMKVVLKGAAKKQVEVDITWTKKATGRLVGDSDQLTLGPVPFPTAEGTATVELLSEGERVQDYPGDELVAEALAAVTTAGRATASVLQRRMKISFTRATQLLEILEKRGAVTGPDRDGVRQLASKI